MTSPGWAPPGPALQSVQQPRPIAAPLRRHARPLLVGNSGPISLDSGAAHFNRKLSFRFPKLRLSFFSFLWPQVKLTYHLFQLQFPELYVPYYHQSTTYSSEELNILTSRSVLKFDEKVSNV
jgi:hypothetical protein